LYTFRAEIDNDCRGSRSASNKTEPDVREAALFCRSLKFQHRLAINNQVGHELANGISLEIYRNLFLPFDLP
jgi:hypothetical protein